MAHSLSTQSSAIAVARLTAVWALSESALGGILHALRVPLMGLIMAGSAVLLISLIAHYAKHPKEILKATLLVLMVKAIGSPHTPLVGYIAVAFQGLFGFIVYSIRRPGKFSTGAFALGALLETAVQRLLTLALFFGATLWEAIDEWGGWILQRYFPSYVDADFSLAMSLVAFYVGIYFVGGLLVGWIAAQLPQRIQREQAKIDFTRLERLKSSESGQHQMMLQSTSNVKRPLIANTKRFFVSLVIISVVLITCIYLGSLGLDPFVAALIYLVRTLSILAAWYFLAGPILAGAIQRWLISRSGKHSSELSTILDSLPKLRELASTEYKELRDTHSGIGLYRKWLPRVLAMSLVV